MGLRFHEQDMELDTTKERSTQSFALVLSPAADLRAQPPLSPEPNERNESAPDPTLPGCPIPFDVLEARRERINNDIISFADTHNDPNVDDTPSFKGMGTYTHIALPSEPPQFPHQQFVPPPSEFLSLGESQYPTQNAHTIRREMLQKSVKEAYEKLKDVMEEEEQLDWRAFSPGIRFHALPVPDVNTLPPRPRQADEDTTMGGVDGATEAVNDTEKSNDEPRRLALVNSGRRPPWGGQRTRPVPDVPVSNVDVTMGGTTALVPTSGSMYDASRDPRRRGR